MYFVHGKLFGRIVINHAKRITESLVGKEQSGLRKGSGCVDLIFASRQAVEELLEKKEEYTLFLDEEKSFENIIRKGCQKVLIVYGRHLNTVKHYYSESTMLV